MTRDDASALRPVLEALSGDGDMPRSARTQAADALEATDVEAVLLRAGKALVALESAMVTGEVRAKQLREAILEVMLEIGHRGKFIAGDHTIGYSTKRHVRVLDAGAVPAEYMEQPPPKPNTQALNAALRAGAIIPGAELSNGTPTLFVRSNKR
jgi:hypothetical protein